MHNLRYLSGAARRKRTVASSRACALALAVAGAWLITVVLAVTGDGTRARAAVQEAHAARPALNVAILVSSRADQCFDSGQIAAIRKLAGIELERINRQGGVHGRRVEVRLLDDASSADKTVANLRAALADPQLLAILGLANSNRAKAAFDTLGSDIKASGVPFVSDISVNSIFASAPNVFTTRASQDDERIPVMGEFMRQTGFLRPAFVGLKDQVFSTALGNGLVAALGDRGLSGDVRLTLKNDQLEPADMAAAFGEMRSKSPDLIVLNVGAARTGMAMRQLIVAGLTPPLLVTGRLDAIPADIVKAYPGDLYQLAWDGLPDVYNDRLRRLIASGNAADWALEGRKVPQAPGWTKGECKDRPPVETPDPLEAANLRAIGVGAQFADMLGLVTAAARTADPSAELKTVRAQVVAELSGTYAAGRGAYKGSFENWSFHKSSRAAARTPFIVMLPKGLGRAQLAPIQFVRLKADTLRRIDTLYADIDMIRAHRIDDNEKTFFAEFYLSMFDNKDLGLDAIEFTNAFLDPKSGERQVTIRTLHGGGRSDAYPDSMRIYQVTGRFIFEPELTAYPYDTQRFSIDISPKRGEKPFIVQPPPLSLRDKALATDGWDAKEQYVGYDADFVPIVDAYSHTPSIVPFYRASFVWMMKRQATDYYLRVVVPLAFILAVAYMSIFIPYTHFEAIITLQVTALLSAVALYLSLPKIDAETATLSDRIFIFNYMLVSLMIGISILRASRLVAPHPWFKAALAAVHVVLVPLLVAFMAIYVWGASRAAG